MEKIDYLKPALTISQQIDLLKTRNMRINDDDKVEEFLKFNNYYRFAGYWKRLAAHGTHMLPLDSQYNDFDWIVKIYKIDEKLRKIILNGLQPLEIALRTQFAHELSLKHDSHFHLNPSLFDGFFEKNKAHLIKQFQDTKENFTEHYLHHYIEDLPPIWVTVEFMTFGTLSKWFDSVNTTDKNLIANNFNYDRTYFNSFIKTATYLRNCCAHYSILWKKTLTKAPSFPNKSEYNYISSRINYMRPKCIFNPIIILQYLLDQINNGNIFRAEINNFLKELDEDTKKDYGIANINLSL